LKIRRYILHRWQNVDNDRENGTWAIRGAREGAAWSYLHRADGQELRKMNQFDWLRARFEENLSSIDKGLPEYFTLPEEHRIG
jgi:hypothetical protein